MKKIFLFAFVCFCTSIINAQELVQEHSKTSVTFKIRNLGVNVDGSFSMVEVKSNFNRDDISNSYLNATIDVKTIDTGNDTRNGSLAKKEYFDIANHEFISLKSTEIVKNSDTNYTLTGKLTIKETEKTVKIPLVVSENGDTVTLNTTFELNRLDYKVGSKSWVMSNTVKIKVNYVAKK